MNSRNQSYVIYLLLFIAIIAMLVYNFSSQSTSQDAKTINELAADVQSGKVKKITEDENRLRIVYNDGSEHSSTIETNATLVQQMLDLGVRPEELSPDRLKIDIRPPSAWLGILTALGYILPFLILGGVFFFIFRQAQGSNNAAMSFGKSRARMFTGDHPTVTFDDVAGADEFERGTKGSG